MFCKTTLTAAAAHLALSGAAQAHATLGPTGAAAGWTTTITLRVPHGCHGPAKNAVRIEVPDGFYAVKPMPEAGRDSATETAADDNHGTEMTQGVRAAIRPGRALPGGLHDAFTVRGAVGPQAAPGEMLYVPAVQTGADRISDWTHASGSDGVPNPAPSVVVVAGDGGGGHGHGDAGMASDGDVTPGDLRIAAPFARATLPNQPVAGGFLTITNTGSADDTLVAARSPAAGRVEVHEMAMDGDVMRMREVAGGLPIPAGATVTLEPGGYHVMFMDLAGPLAEGDKAEVTLTFDRAGDVTLTLPVLARNAVGGGHGDHGTPKPGEQEDN